MKRYYGYFKMNRMQRQWFEQHLQKLDRIYEEAKNYTPRNLGG